MEFFKNCNYSIIFIIIIYMLLFNLYCGRPNIENMTDITSKVKDIYTQDIEMIDKINKIIVNNKITFDDCTIDGKLYLLPTGNNDKIELLSKLNFLGAWSIQTTNDTFDIKYNNESKINVKTNNNNAIKSKFDNINDVINSHNDMITSHTNVTEAANDCIFRGHSHGGTGGNGGTWSDSIRTNPYNNHNGVTCS